MVSDEFYVGYEPQMPSKLASRIRRVARALIAVALLLPAVLISAQGRFSSGVFEFGRPQMFRGQIIEFPYPALIVSDAAGVSASYWLVGEGKHGAADLVRGRDGQQVKLSGTLIQRDEDRMIEVGSGAVTTTGPSSQTIESLRSHGEVEIQGEIVDSKCHLGVMKPGEGPTHRDCAVRCLLGRVPPMFVPHDHASLRRLSLVSVDRHAFEGDASRWAGRAVSIRGELLERGAQRFLATSPSAIRILK